MEEQEAAMDLGVGNERLWLAKVVSNDMRALQHVCQVVVERELGVREGGREGF